MIDDDIESVVRKMIEQFTETFGTFPEGNVTIRSWTGSFVNEPLESEIKPKGDEPIVEKIDLGDSVIFLIQGHFDTSVEPVVKVDGENITVKLDNETQSMNLEPGFLIDLEKSNISNRNGVIEIVVFRAENQEESRGYLKLDKRE